MTRDRKVEKDREKRKADILSMFEEIQRTIEKGIDNLREMGHVANEGERTEKEHRSEQRRQKNSKQTERNTAGGILNNTGAEHVGYQEDTKKTNT